MKKLAILAAAAIGYALANRVGRKQDLGFSGPTPARPDYAPAGTDPFVASAQEVPLRVVEDLPEEPVVEEVFAPVEADPHALSDAAAEVDEAIEAELHAEPEVEPVIADVVPSTPVAETQEEPEVTRADASESAVTESIEPEVEQVSAPPVIEDDAAETETPASTWDESWVDDMPAPETQEETPAEEPVPEASEDSSTAEANPEPKLSEIAEGINERIRTAAELAREEEPVVENLDELESDADALDTDETSLETFVPPTVGDFADEVFEDEVPAGAGSTSDTALLDAIDDEADKA